MASLDALSIPYMLTGSTVSSLQGEPRATHDIDLVAALQPGSAALLAAAFPPPDFYLDPDSASEAIDAGEMFNLIDVNEGDKVDFWMLTGDPWDQSRWARREQVPFLGCALWVSSPEDTILAKLRWSRLAGGSEKQLGDARGVFDLQRDRLDRGYLEHWAARLGVQEDLRRLFDEPHGRKPTGGG